MHDFMVVRFIRFPCTIGAKWSDYHGAYLVDLASVDEDKLKELELHGRIGKTPDGKRTLIPGEGHIRARGTWLTVQERWPKMFASWIIRPVSSEDVLPPKLAVTDRFFTKDDAAEALLMSLGDPKDAEKFEIHGSHEQPTINMISFASR